MSMFSATSMTCPKCSAEVAFQAVDSVNADRRPDLRASILDGSFQRHNCESCGTEMRLAPRMVYLDIGRAQWILVRPADALTEWVELEQTAQQVFGAAYGAEAPAAARDIGCSLATRVTFGWPALQEKLLCAELALDDVTLELVKAALLRTQGRVPLSDRAELRLIGGKDDSLAFAWLDARTEEAVEFVSVPCAVYDRIAADPAPWAAVRAELAGGPFVDVHRALVSASPMP
jgi:hypothetical protein